MDQEIIKKINKHWVKCCMDGSTTWLDDATKHPSKYSGYLIEEFKVEDYETQQAVMTLIQKWAKRRKRYLSKMYLKEHKIVSTKK